METLGRARFKVTYNSKDISEDLSKYLLSIKYHDKTEKEADELTITLENVDALWENDWYPEKGAKLTAQIGTDQLLMDCGEFELDEIEISSPPDQVTLRAISAPISGSMRTKKSTGHESTSLKDIVQKIASSNGLTVEGEITDIQFTRITQNRETDLGFLRRLADLYGFMFSVRGTRLTFTDMNKVMGADPVITIDREDCASYSIKDKSAKVFRNAEISFHDAQKKSVVTQTYQPGTYSEGTLEANKMPEGIACFAPATGDTYKNYVTVDNESQAEAVAKAALVRANTMQQEGSITKEGDPILVAGINFEFTGIGKLSGKYHICESEHSVDKQGYDVTLTIKRVGFIELVKHKRKRIRKKQGYEVRTIQ